MTILSKTIIKKDAEFSELKADNDKRLYQLSKAKQLIDSSDERVAKAEEKASEQEARANCLAHDLNRVEDELRALKRDSNNFTIVFVQRAVAASAAVVQGAPLICTPDLVPSLEELRGNLAQWLLGENGDAASTEEPLAVNEKLLRVSLL